MKSQWPTENQIDIIMQGAAIMLERQLQEQYEADQIYIKAHYCPGCGAKLNDGKCEYCDVDTELDSQTMPDYEAHPAW